MCASSAKPRPRASSSSHAGMRICESGLPGHPACLAERERARRRRRERRDLRERREQCRCGGPNHASRRLVGHDEAAAGQEDGDDERQPERGGPDHPAFSVAPRRVRARSHCARYGCAFASSAFGFPRSAAATTDWSPWLHALRADATEASAARCAASFRRAVSACGEVARQLALLLGEGAGPGLRLAQRPAAGSERGREHVGLPRPLVQRPTAIGDDDAKPAGDLLGGDGAPPPVLGATVVRTDAVGEHPDDEHEHDRDGDGREADGPAPDLQRELLRPFDPRRLHTSLSACAARS